MDPKNLAKTAYRNYIQDCTNWAEYDIIYESYMDKIIGDLIDLQSDHTDNKDVTDTSLIVTNTDNNKGKTRGSRVTSRCGSETEIKHELIEDINNPLKTRGYMAVDSNDFQLIGPDRTTESIVNVHQYLRIAKIIKQSGLPNYPSSLGFQLNLV